jgi:hypothetical protein
VALLFKSCPEVLYVFRPFRWEMLDYGTSWGDPSLPIAILTCDRTCLLFCMNLFIDCKVEVSRITINQSTGTRFGFSNVNWHNYSTSTASFSGNIYNQRYNQRDCGYKRII